MTIKGKDLLNQIKNKEFSEEVVKELEKHEVNKPKTVWDLKQGDVCWKVGVYNNGGTTPVITQSGTLTISATVTDNRNKILFR